ncbi:hypothetical protein TrRE_jg1925 [Triparma retinervis]|uniref:Uncharacterized protein n=1 Tax=Triparma retinervis TaxID=2557542 RepID=A0A9W6ZNR2_9STRA|nr:hypothetical protein TrRE_jg1925 [Triparma retinervis]
MVKVVGLGVAGLRMRVSVMEMAKETGLMGAREAGDIVVKGGLESEGGHLWVNVKRARGGGMMRTRPLNNSRHNSRANGKSNGKSTHCF